MCFGEMRYKVTNLSMNQTALIFYVNDAYFALHYNFPCLYIISVARGYSTY